MTDYDSRGQVALWKREKRNDRSPVLGGTIVAHRDIKEGETLEVSLWKNEGPGNAPVLKGKMSDPYKAGPAPQQSAPSGPDDDLPFS